MTQFTNSVIPGGFTGGGAYQTTNISNSGGQPPMQRPTDLPGVTPGGPGGGFGGGFGSGGTGLTSHAIDVVDQGFFTDTGNQNVGLLDGSLAGIIGDGNGNFTWAFQTLNTPSGTIQTNGGYLADGTEPQRSVTQAPLSEDQFDFDSIVDLVDDLGADASGSEPSDNALAALNGLNEKVQVNVPNGNYRFTGKEHDLTNPQSVGFVTNQEQAIDRSQEPVADGGASGPTFTVPSGFERVWMRFSGDILWKGINIDRSAGAGPGIAFEDCGKILIEDVGLLGPDISSRDGSVFTVSATNTVVFRDMDLQGSPSSQGDRTGIGVPESNTANVWLESCSINGFSNGGYIGHMSQGGMTALGGTYRNNGVVQIRVPADNYLIDGATIGTTDDCQYSGDIDGVQTA